MTPPLLPRRGPPPAPDPYGHACVLRATAWLVVLLAALCAILCLVLTTGAGPWV